MSLRAVSIYLERGPLPHFQAQLYALGGRGPWKPTNLSTSDQAVGERDMGDAKLPNNEPEAATLIAVRSLSPATTAGRPSTANLPIGTVFANRYEILGLLGEGGMGAVYKASDLELEREVALKVIRPELSNDPEILQRFKQELILARQVTDRNIIRIFDLGESGSVRFITMEYVEGENLHHILTTREKLPVSEAVDIMRQAAAGLGAAHREGIIHRDLKPGNIMRDRNGRVVVMDFGLARTALGDGMTKTGSMLGTMEYMSPEQALAKEVKPSSDVFTLGLILFEMLSGKTPFHAESAIASLLMRTQHRASPLADIDKTIPVALSNIVAKCLESDPAKRYQSAAELDSDLLAWQGNSGGRVSASSAHLLSNRLREAPWRWIAGALLIAGAAGGGTLWMVRSRQAAAPVNHAPVSILVADFANRTGDPLLDDTLEPMFALGMEGASFINAFSRGDARRLAAKLPNHSEKLDEGTARLLAVTQGLSAIITGQIEERGGKYEVSARAVDAVSGKVLAKAEVSVENKQDILGSLPKLAAPIRKALGDTTPDSIQFQEVSGGFIAASLDAVHQDSEGVEEQFAGKFQEAFASFKKATELDPKFARAYTGMAAMSQNLGRQADALKYMELAMANVDRMTEREKYRNRGLYYLTKGDWQHCVAEYNQLVTRYPADRVGQNNLANCYTQLRDSGKALQAAQRAVAIVPKGVGQRLNLGFISAFAGDFQQSEKEARAAIAMNPSAGQAYLVLAEAQIGQAQVESAAESYTKLASFGGPYQSIASAGLADLAAYEGRFTQAARLLDEGAAADIASKSPDEAARKFATLAEVEVMRGNSAGAAAAAARAFAINQGTQVAFLAARAYADSGDLGKAQKLAGTLSYAITSESKAYGKIISGLVALKKKNANQAIQQISEANTLLDTWIGHFDLGRAYLEAGAFTEADAQFELCMERRGEAIELFMDNVPTYAYLPYVYYYQGRAREGMKSDSFADLYKTYLGIRGQASQDPLVPEIRRRAGL